MSILSVHVATPADSIEVFVVMEIVPFEYGEVKAVFSSREKAEAYIQEIVPKSNFDITSIESHVVDSSSK